MKSLKAPMAGALWGMIAWQTYAVVEFAIVALAPQARYGLVLADWYWRISLILLASYTLAGLAFGAIFGVIVASRLPSHADRRYQIAAAITLMLAFIANLVTGRSRWPALVAALIFGGMLVLSLTSEFHAKRFGGLANPWVCSAFLLIAGWVDNEAFPRRSAALRLGLIVLLMAVFAVSSMVAGRIRSRFSPSLRWQSTTVICAALAGCVWGLWHDRGLPVPSNSQGSLTSRRPNVILVTMDTVRADHLSLYGYARNTTPNLIDLGKSSTVYAHPAAASNGTLTSHSAILTGVYVSWNGARTNGGLQEPVSRQFPMLAELLQRQGYTTAAYIANSAYLIPYFGFDRGFQVFESRNAVRVLTPEKSYCLRQGVRRLLSHVMNTTEFDLSFLRANEINRLAFRFLEQAKSQPFFLFLNYMDAHGPYIPPEPYNTLFQDKESLTSAMNDAEAVEAGHDSPGARAHMISQYDGGVAYIDAQIGDLVSRLKQMGLYDNTLLVITADHGEGFGEHGYWGHGSTVYESVVYVPLLIKYPGQRFQEKAEKSGESAGHTDILPTVLDVTGTPPPPSIQGRNLKASHTDAARLLLSEAFPSPPGARTGKRDYTERALYSGTFKFVETTQGMRTLYDLSSDPGETNDLCAVAPQCSEMKTQLETWASAVPTRATGKTKLDSKSMEHLKSLGYIGQ